MDRSIQVEVEGGADAPRPTAFRWQGHRHPIVDWGRHWQAQDGDHFLVMVPGRRVFELCTDPSNGTWRLCRTAKELGFRGRAL